VFKNSTEEEFARILDMYGIEWMYEPKTFPIEWDAEGNIKMAFSPDFYLPKFNIYLELTTMDQKYVTKKNKKARMVMELYPGTTVKIVYKKDFHDLVERLKQFGG
ncbi:MAG: cytidylate kinase-like family protein, partial [Clostridiales bacterium]|nr:cytidylate kinase-like family protein [Clostridiales bacterium]